MVVRITRNGVEGVDTNTSWTGSSIPSGLTKNIYRWGTYGVDRGNDGVSLTPFAYCHWGSVSTAAQTGINRRWNVSSVARNGTGLYRVNFSDPASQYAPNGDYISAWESLGVFIGLRRHTGSNNIGYGHLISEPNHSYVNIQFRTHAGTAIDPGYMWVMILGGEKNDLTNSGTLTITGDRMYKYDPDGTTARTMHRAGSVRFNGASISNGGTFTVFSPGYSYSTSILKHSTGEYTTTFSYQGSTPIDSTNQPIALSLSRRSTTGTGIQISCPESSETYIGNQVRWRCASISNNPVDVDLSVVMF